MIRLRFHRFAAGICILFSALQLTCAPISTTANPAGSSIACFEFVADSMPTAQCHASTIVEIESRIVVAWFGGSYEGAPDVGIWLSHKTGTVWSPPVQIAEGFDDSSHRSPCWNPVLYKAAGGVLVLFYKVGPNPREWWGMVKTSHDGGMTWSAARRLPEGISGPAKNKPITLGNGTLLCPSSTENHSWQVWFERTTDFGMTWSKLGPMNDTATIEAIQPAFMQRVDGTLQALGRTRQSRIFTMESSDNGTTWTAMSLLNFWCANSGLDAVALKDGRMLVVYNHGRNITEKWAAGREMLNVAISRDGHEWRAACVLEREANAEFSYPAVIQTSDGFVHITYTWKRLRIRHVVLDPTKLGGRSFSGMEWE